MKKKDEEPIYSKVAYDIASKIAAGEIKEKERFSGRSLMSSQYGVSPETIRRAIRLLQDMGILHVEQNVGAVALSQTRAREYVNQHCLENDMRNLSKRLKQLTTQRDTLNREIEDVMGQIEDLGRRFRYTGAVRTYEFALKSCSPLVGKTIGELQFRNHTSATIVALRREEGILLSPNPTTRLACEDVLVCACEISAVDKVAAFIEG